MAIRPEIKQKIRQKAILRYLPFFFTLAFLISSFGFLYYFVVHNPDLKASAGLNTQDNTHSIECRIIQDDSFKHLGNELSPILITFTHEDLKILDLGGKVLNKSGSNIRFLSAQGEALVAEIERFEPFSGKLTAWIHINKEIVSAQKIIIQCGDQTEPAGELSGFGYPYYAVWHMNRGFQSSAAYPMTGEYRRIKDTEGKICGAKEFNASAMASIAFERPTEFPKSGNIQVSAWIMTQKNGETQQVFSDKDNKGGCGLLINSESCPVFELYNGRKETSLKSKIHLKPETWYKVTAGYDSGKNQLYIYVNDKLAGEGPAQWAYQAGGRPVLGAAPNRRGDFFNGSIDEVRISSMPNNAGMIQLQYRYEHNPELFLHQTAQDKVLPPNLVRISNLEAEGKGDHITVRWSAENEKEITSYLLERSAESDSFVTVASCEVNPEAASSQQYILFDKNPVPGELLYRICSMGKQGKQVLSSPVKAQFTRAENTLSIENVTPNPFKDEFAVIFNTAFKLPVQVSLTSISGEIVHRSDLLPKNEGEQVFHYQNSGTLVPGIYFLNLKQSDFQRTLKLVKRS